MNNEGTFNEESTTLSAANVLCDVGEKHHSILLTRFSKVIGAKLLARRIHTEIGVLQKGLSRASWLKVENIGSSNLHQLGAVVELVQALGDKVDGVMQKYQGENSMPVFVDVVANGGLTWIKVLCRCPNAVQFSYCTGDTGQRSVLQQARQLQQLAAVHTVLYMQPQVVFVFCKGVSRSVHKVLQRQGVLVLTPAIIPDSHLSASQYQQHSLDDSGDVAQLNHSSSDMAEIAPGCSVACNVKESSDALTATKEAPSDDESYDGCAAEAAAEDGDEKTAATGDLKKSWEMWSQQDIGKIAEQVKQLSNYMSDLAEYLRPLKFSNKLPIKASVKLVHKKEASPNHIKVHLNNPIEDESIAETVIESNAIICSENFNSLESAGAKSDEPCNNTSTYDCSNYDDLKTAIHGATTQIFPVNISGGPKLTVNKKSNAVSDAVAPELFLLNINDVSGPNLISNRKLNIVSDTNILENSYSKINNCDNIVEKEPLRLSTTMHPAFSNCTSTTTSIQEETGLRDSRLSENPVRRLVFLDVTCIIAYVSNISNGYSNFNFCDDFMRKQAAWERKQPVKEVIERYWQGSERRVCEEAVKRVESILSLMAGDEERRRAQQLLSTLTLVPDCDQLQCVMPECGRVTASTRIIFGTAMHHRAPIITANTRSLRSAASQGVDVAALVHGPRALTEKKQSISEPFLADKES